MDHQIEKVECTGEAFCLSSAQVASAEPMHSLSFETNQHFKKCLEAFVVSNAHPERPYTH
jgi:hypothetical protein